MFRLIPVPKPNNRLVIKVSNDVIILYAMINAVAIIPNSTSCNFFINDYVGPMIIAFGKVVKNVYPFYFRYPFCHR
jgi:hypothetical protein